MNSETNTTSIAMRSRIACNSSETVSSSSGSLESAVATSSSEIVTLSSSSLIGSRCSMAGRLAEEGKRRREDGGPQANRVY